MSVPHKIALDIPTTSAETVLKISDASAYTELPSTGRQLDVWTPGFQDPSSILEADLPLGFTKLLTAQTLGLQDPNSTIPGILPDGVYTVKYTVSAGGHEVTYYHMRISRLLNLYNRELCKLGFIGNVPTRDEKEKLAQLSEIRMYMDAAKAKTEYCHSPKEGAELYAYAEKLLMKLVFKGCAGGDCNPCADCSPCADGC